MQEFWNIISRKHRERLNALAESKGIDSETAMRNIVNYLKNENTQPGCPDYFKELITAKHIEEFIDTITR